jgi:hypothetical protein
MRTATAFLIGLSLLATPLAFGATAHEENAQQEKMKTCNADASAKHLSGDARKDFMKTCLSSDDAANGKELTPQQQKMSACSKDAAGQHLTGDERKKFMSSCLSK